MSTMAQPQPAAGVWKPETAPRATRPVWALLSTWFWLLPLFYFAVHGNPPALGGPATSSDPGMLHAENASMDTLGKAIRVGYVLLCIVLLAPAIKPLAGFIWRNKIQLLLPGLAVLSVAWSQVHSTTLIESTIALLLPTLVAYYFVQRYSPEQQMQVITLLSMVISVACLLFAVLLPAYGIDQGAGGHVGALQGVFAQKNSAARTMIFLLPAVACLRPRDSFGRMIRGSALFLTLLVIALTQSRTGWLLAVLCFANLSLLKSFGKFRRRDATVLLFAFLILLSGVIAVLASSWREILVSLGRDPTLTGRTPLWAAVMESISKKPWLGYGYSAFWIGLKGESLRIILTVHWAVPYAHNGFLEVLLQLGIVGLVFLLIVLFKAWKDAYTCFVPNRHQSVDWYITILLLTVFYNLDEGTFLARFEIAWFLFLVAALGLAVQAKKSLAENRKAKQGKTPGAMLPASSILTSV